MEGERKSQAQRALTSLCNLSQALPAACHSPFANGAVSGPAPNPCRHLFKHIFALASIRFAVHGPRAGRSGGKERHCSPWPAMTSDRTPPACPSRIDIHSGVLSVLRISQTRIVWSSAQQRHIKSAVTHTDPGAAQWPEEKVRGTGFFNHNHARQLTDTYRSRQGNIIGGGGIRMSGCCKVCSPEPLHRVLPTT